MSSHPDSKNRLINWIVNNPLRSLLIGGVISLLFLPALEHIQTNFSYRIWFSEADQSLQEFDKFESEFGSDAVAMLAIHSPNGVFDQETVELLHKLTNELWRVPQVIRVNSLTNFSWVHAENGDLMVEPLVPEKDDLSQKILNERGKVALNHKIIKNYLVSENGKTAMIHAILKPSLKGSPQYGPVIAAIRGIMTKYQNHGDHSFYLAGNPVLTFSFKEVAYHDVAHLIPLLSILIMVVLFALTRQALGTFMPLLVVGISVTVSLAIAALLGKEVNNLTAILPQLLLAVGIATSVHILVSFFQARKAANTAKESVVFALEHNLKPTFLTMISTSIGFLSFASTDVIPIATLGIVAGIGTTICWLVTIFIMSPLLILLSGDSRDHFEYIDLEKPNQISVSATRIVQRYRAPIMGVFGFLTAMGIFFTFKISVDSNPFNYFLEEHPLKKSLNFIEDQVGGIWGPEIVVNAGGQDGVKEPEFLQRVEIFQNWLDQIPKVTKTISILDAIKETNRSLHDDDPNFYKLPTSKELIAQELFLFTMNLPQGQDVNNQITPLNDALRISVFWTIKESAESTRNVELIKNKARELGLDVTLTGKNVIYNSLNDHVVSTFIQSILLAIGLISILLAIVFRSVKIGLMAMIPNLFPLALGGGLLYLLGFSLDIGTAIVSAVCLGISVDDTIHFLNHYYAEKKKGADNHQAMAMIFSYTAPALLATTIVLILGFGVLIFATFVPNIHFGVMVALVFGIALITDLTLLPAILLDKEKRNEGQPSEPALEESRLDAGT